MVAISTPQRAARAPADRPSAVRCSWMNVPSVLDSVIFSRTDLRGSGQSSSWIGYGFDDARERKLCAFGDLSYGFG